MALNTVTLGGKPTYDPPGEAALNRFVMRTGASRYGRGVFALLRKDYDQLVLDTAKLGGKTELVMKGDPGPGLKLNVLIAGAEPITTVVGQNATTDLMKVTVYDLRSTGFTPLKKFINVTVDGFPLDGSGKPVCYASTLKATTPPAAPGFTPYSWDDVMMVLLGSADNIPNSVPAFTPYNLIWDNVPIANAIDDVAAQLFYVVGFDHQDTAFTQSLDLFPPYQSALGTETQDTGYDANFALLDQIDAKGALIGGAVPGSSHAAERNYNRLPGQIQVVFPGVGTADPYDTHRVYTSTQSTGFGTSDYVVPLTIGNYYGVWSGSAWVNQTAMDTMAADLASRASIFMSQAFGQAEFGGIWPFRPDGRFRQVEWRSDATGTRTIVRSDNAKDWLPTDALDDPVNLNANQEVVSLGSGKTFVNASGTKFVTISNVGAMVFVNLTKTSGSIGTQTTTSSWVYTATNLAGTQLGTGLSPLAATRRNGALAFASAGTGYVNTSGTFVLVQAFESTSTGHC